jgi:hypothetical protein
MLESFVKEFNERNPEARAEYVPRGGWVGLFGKLYAAIAGAVGADALTRVGAIAKSGMRP